jgi:AcrR family transcriptional regulator
VPPTKPGVARKETAGGVATREFIIETATDLFGQFGYQAVTVRQLTLAAGVNLSAITYHFGGKEELYRTTVETLMERIGGLIGAPVRALRGAVEQAGGDRAALLTAAEAFIRDWAQLVLANEDVQRRLPVLAMELVSPSLAFPIIYEHFYRRLYEALGGLIGAVVDLEPGSLALTVRVHGVASLMLGFVASERVFWRALDWEAYSGERVEQLAPHLAAVFLSAVGFR